jgi:hypothetical protein
MAFLFLTDKVDEKEESAGAAGDWYADPYGDGARRWFDPARGWSDRVEGEGEEPDKTGLARMDEAADDSTGDHVDDDGKPARLSRPVDPGMLGKA